MHLDASLSCAADWNYLLEQCSATAVSYLGTMLYPQTGAPPGTASTQSVPQLLLCPHRRTSPFPGPEIAPLAPSCCRTWSCPDTERFYSLAILQAPSQRVALFSGTFYPLACSVTSDTILHIATTQCHSAKLQNFSCFPGSCLCTRSPLYHKQWQDWITSTQQTGKFLIMPDHRLALSGWEPGQKIKCWGLISTNLREMYRWTGQFLFIDWNPWSHSNMFKLAISEAKGITIVLSMRSSIPIGKNEFFGKDFLPYFLVIWIRALDNHSWSVSQFHQPCSWGRTLMILSLHMASHNTIYGTRAFGLGFFRLHYSM